MHPRGADPMDKRIAGLLGAAAALTTMTVVQSAVADTVLDRFHNCA
jgi:hypothetical protein